MSWVLAWRYLPHAAVGAIVVAALGYCALDQRERGREAERAAQHERRADTETEILERKRENAEDAASGSAVERLRDGRASHTAPGALPDGDAD